jgi:hypothetical protein
VGALLLPRLFLLSCSCPSTVRLDLALDYVLRSDGTTGLQLSIEVSQKMNFGPQFEITNSVTAELTRIERARGFLDAAKLSEDWIAGMQKRALVLEAHYTTHIEGTQLTLEQSERILAGQKVRGARRMMRKSSSTAGRRSF